MFKGLAIVFALLSLWLTALAFGAHRDLDPTTGSSADAIAAVACAIASAGFWHKRNSRAV